MRHYNKLKRELREIYQQPRPHRWDAVASRMRQRATLQALLDLLAQVPKKLADALSDMAKAINKMLGTDPSKPGIITIHPPIVAPRAIGRTVLMNEINNKLIPPMGMMVSKEEQDHIDMLRARSYERHVAAGHIQR